MEDYNKNLELLTEKHNNSTYLNELTSIGKKLFGKKYKGTYARDDIKKIKLSDASPYCIINNSYYITGGEHWTALCKYPNKKSFLFYDSFGRSYKDLIPELKFLGKIKDTDRDVEQKKTEYNCGQRCLSFLLVCDEFGMKTAEKI